MSVRDVITVSLLVLLLGGIVNSAIHYQRERLAQSLVQESIEESVPTVVIRVERDYFVVDGEYISYPSVARMVEQKDGTLGVDLFGRAEFCGFTMLIPADRRVDFIDAYYAYINLHTLK
jgi:hypothetical protein